MSAKKNVLGRGFDGLIPTGMNVADVTVPGERIKNISIEMIVPNDGQPRKHFDEDALQELAASIKQHGIIQPIIVTPQDGGLYRIVAGERRYRASQIAKVKDLPAVVRNHKELEELEVAIVENVQRVDLSPLEQAVSIARLRDQFSLSVKEISQKLGKAETTISNLMRLLHLPENAMDALRKNLITEGHARAILSLKDDKQAQENLLNKILTQKLTVRDAEASAQANKTYSHNTKKGNSETVRKLIEKRKLQLNTKIKVKEKNQKGSGILSVTFSSFEELDTLLGLLEEI